MLQSVAKTKNQAISKHGYISKMLIHYTDLYVEDSREILIVSIMS